MKKSLIGGEKNCYSVMSKFTSAMISVLLSMLLVVSCDSDEENSTTPGKVTVYLVRHGKTILNNTDKVQGWADGTLTEEGAQLIKNVGKGLSDVRFEAVYSSDLGRAVATARLILSENLSSGELALSEGNELYGLREAYFGKYEGDANEEMWGEVMMELGLTSIEGLFAYPNPMETFLNTVAALDETEEAEDYNTVLNRSWTALNTIAEDAWSNGGGNVLVVSHGITMGILAGKIDPDLQMGQFSNGSVTEIEYENGVFAMTDVFNSLEFAETAAK